MAHMHKEQKTEDKLLHASALWTALEIAGIATYSYARKWLKRMEMQGHIVYPERASAQEKRKFTAEQISEIVTAFRPGGSHTWSWSEKENIFKS